MNNCFSIYHTSWITSGPKSNFICDKIPTKAILFFLGCSEVNSTWLISSELANQRARKVLFTCVVYTNVGYWPLDNWKVIFLRIWTETESRSLNTSKRERGQYSACSGRRSQRRIWFILLTHGTDYIITLYVILLAASKRDKPNPTLWLATWAGKMALLSCPFGVSCKKMLLRMSFNKLFIGQDGLIFASFFRVYWIWQLFVP